MAVDSRQGDIFDFHIFVRPFVEQLHCANFLRDVLWKHWVTVGGFDLDLAIVRHFEGCLTAGMFDLAEVFWVFVELSPPI
jgi:hypothetical protein